MKNVMRRFSNFRALLGKFRAVGTTTRATLLLHDQQLTSTYPENARIIGAPCTYPFWHAARKAVFRCLAQRAIAPGLLVGGKGEI